MRHGCEVILKDWYEELETFLTNRKVFDLKQMNEKFCGNGKKVKSITNSCYNITLQDFPSHYSAWDLKDYFIFDPRRELEEKLDSGASKDEIERYADELRRYGDL